MDADQRNLSALPSSGLSGSTPLFSEAEREHVESLRAKTRAAWAERRKAFVGCSRLGHEDRAATHRARWTVYGGGTRSIILCEECATRGRGQRGVQIETLTPTFGGLHVGQ